MNIAKFLIFNFKSFFMKYLRWLLRPFTTTCRNYYLDDHLVILFALIHPSKWLREAAVRTCFSKRCFKKNFLRKFCNLYRKHLRSPTLVFSCEFWKIFRTPFFIEHIWWLLLDWTWYMFKADNRKGRSNEICLKLTIKTSKKKS